jgi:Abnormal spindle-like microcephaly-assoc'd, ASPM-SPD-2-Hydin
MKRLFCVLGLTVIAAACGSSTTAPTTPPPVATPTRIISVTGDLGFGNVNIGSSASRTFTISNSGNSVLTYTSLNAVGGTGATGYTATPLSSTVPAGGSVTVTVKFAPPVAGFLSNVLTVIGDQTSGGNAINVSGNGVNPNPIFTTSGSGNTVFDIPSYVTRIHITGTYSGFTSNFIVYVGSALVVNDLIGSAWASHTSDGTYLIAGGGTVQITNSSGVNWTFTEVR